MAFTITALRGAATLRARLQKGNGAAAIALADEGVEGNKEATVTAALSFVAKGGELLKRTRKGKINRGTTLTFLEILQLFFQQYFCSCRRSTLETSLFHHKLRLAGNMQSILFKWIDCLLET